MIDALKEHAGSVVVDERDLDEDALALNAISGAPGAQPHPAQCEGERWDGHHAEHEEGEVAHELGGGVRAKFDAIARRILHDAPREDSAVEALVLHANRGEKIDRHREAAAGGYIQGPKAAGRVLHAADAFYMRERGMVAIAPKNAASDRERVGVKGGAQATDPNGMPGDIYQVAEQKDAQADAEHEEHFVGKKTDHQTHQYHPGEGAEIARQMRFEAFSNRKVGEEFGRVASLGCGRRLLKAERFFQARDQVRIFGDMLEIKRLGAADGAKPQGHRAHGAVDGVGQDRERRDLLGGKFGLLAVQKIEGLARAARVETIFGCPRVEDTSPEAKERGDQPDAAPDRDGSKERRPDRAEPVDPEGA